MEIGDIYYRWNMPDREYKVRKIGTKFVYIDWFNEPLIKCNFDKTNNTLLEVCNINPLRFYTKEGLVLEQNKSKLFTQLRKLHKTYDSQWKLDGDNALSELRTELERIQAQITKIEKLTGFDNY